MRLPCVAVAPNSSDLHSPRVSTLCYLTGTCRKCPALEAGSDDYVTKPPTPNELIARIGALARRGGLSKEASDFLEIDGYLLNRKTRTVIKGEESIPLTRREFDLAWFLFDNLAKFFPDSTCFDISGI
ncbi:MAG: DNA-binding response OmpR family regulator [Lysobacterales bacterium]|jgi:DNA-binding response OmpR family regulator